MTLPEGDRPKFLRDSKRESIVGEFLDLKFYPIYFNNSTRITDRKMQLAGVDIISKLKGGNEELLIDEKAATSWANREISTFALELNFLLGGEEIGGWFFPRIGETLTTHWAFIWPRTSGGDITSIGDIVSVEVMLIETKKLRRWVKRMASKSKISLDECVNYLRKSETEREINWGGLRILISRQLSEQPINILIPKDILMAISNSNNWQL
tara:strand:+ start:28 stop:660 length:633 start_codon:yes stop_codon:yes gene_type:complete